MGKFTKIEWCDSTVNPTDFQCCGCELWNKTTHDCYAGRFAERRAGKGAFDKPVVLKPGRMAEAARWSDLRGTRRPDKPWLDGRPRVIFIGDMADVLQPDVPFDYLWREVIDVVASAAGRRHIWMLLTKQAKRLVTFQAWLAGPTPKLGGGIGWPSNLWPGVSITSNRVRWRVDELMKVDSPHRFISYEPAWEYVNFYEWLSRISLLIIGGQSGARAKAKPFDILWADQPIDPHHRLGIRTSRFVKQLGSNCITGNANMHDWPESTIFQARGTAFASARVKLKHPKGGDWSEWPPELRIRQFPVVI